MKTALTIMVALCCLCAFRAGSTAADTAIGDWGHFISYWPKAYVNNPDGKAFTLTVHAMRWAIPRWNPPEVSVRVTAPGGKVVFAESVEMKDAVATVSIPAGPSGAYLVEVNAQLGKKAPRRVNFWLSSSLGQSVLWTGDPKGHAIEGQRAVWQASVPRRWWFWVPKDVTTFTCRAQRADRYMSQREDWGFFVVTPRGQRIRALWGQPALTSRKEYRQEQTVEVEVEPGAGGRFWALEVRLGDSHNYSNINFSLDGVPPYIARSPEEWFNLENADSPRIELYDETPFIQSARIESVLKERWPDLQHFSPAPALGDPDGVEILGNGRFSLWNPEGRALGFRIGTYLPRTGFDTPPTAHVKIKGPRRLLLDKQITLKHIHGAHGHPSEKLDPAKGVLTAEVTGKPERWMAFTYPATPLVLMGEEIGDGWQRFRFSCGTVRNWYFFVPKNTREFSLRAAAEHDTDVMHFQVCAPDRTLALIYGNKGEKTVQVPEGLAGKVWFLRPDVGSATRMITRKAEKSRFLDILLTVELKGVPGYLSPTWEQWFDPRGPVRPEKR